MSPQAVPWRRVLAALAVVSVALGATFVIIRSDGFSAIDATVPRATRWFVHQASGNVILADGFTGRALARLEAPEGVTQPEVAQGAGGASVIDRNDATTRLLDQAALRLGSPQSVGITGRPGAVIGVGQIGLVAVDPDSGDAVLVPPGDEQSRPFSVSSSPDTIRIGPGGAVWVIADGVLSRVTTTGGESFSPASSSARLALVGDAPLLFEPDSLTVTFDGGRTVSLPGDVPPSEVVLQVDGPAASCGWLGANDEMWCIGRGGIEEAVSIESLDIDGPDQLAVAGDAAALVRAGRSEIVRIDWRRGTVSDGDAASVPTGSNLTVSAGPDLVWVDHTDGDRVWAINPWGIRAIAKNDANVPLIGDTGEVIGDSDGGQVAVGVGADDTQGGSDDVLDQDGIADPPIARDDAVTARTGPQVTIDVTANDYDPDGDAIAVVEVDDPKVGRVEISGASTVTYRPDTGFVGVDDFEYTIKDGTGREDRAVVTVELLSADAPNRAPIGKSDVAETGAGADVVVDVLLNDIDPERDALRIDSFTQPEIGSVIEVMGPSMLPALRYEPPAEASGSASFVYRPVDSLGAIGDPVEVEVTIAASTAENRPPIVRPDSVLVQRGFSKNVPVLANDVDPDGDTLTVRVSTPLPDGITATVDGSELIVLAEAGAAELTQFAYIVDDGNGHQQLGNVLVVLLDEDEPNRAPIAVPDSANVVAGTQALIDVLSNDSDPENDPLTLLAVRRDGPGGGAITVRGNSVSYVAPSAAGNADLPLDQFEYTVTDGRGQRSVGEVTVRILPEPLAEPPYAQNDVATTNVDVAVTIDVLRNDGDPSGERPALVGTPGCPSGGVAEVVGDRVRFTPPPDQDGQFVCNYEVINSQGLGAEATITVNVIRLEASNLPPIARNDRKTVDVGGTIRIEVLENDTDPEGLPLSLVNFIPPSPGTARPDGNSIVYTAGGSPGIVTIPYEIRDAEGEPATANVIITVTDIPIAPPNASDDARTIQGPGVATVFDVLLNDDDPDGNVADLTVVGASIVSGDGDVEHGDSTVTITPDPDFVGRVVATYTIEDLDGERATANVTLTVLEPSNRPPRAGDDTASVIGGGTVRVALGRNDSDPDGDPLTYRILSPPDTRLGLTSIDGSTLVFSAAPDASGIARATYEVSDGEETATAAVTIEISPCGAANPVAPDAFYETGYQQPITIDLTALAANGEIVSVDPPLSQPIATYTPPAGENGNIQVGYRVRNSCGLEASGLVTIDVNQDPVATAYSSSIGREKAVQIPISVLASDDEPLTISGLEGAPSWVSVVSGGSAVLVDPGGRSGVVEFRVIIADPGGLTVKVPVAITLVNQAPVANGDVVQSNGSVTTFSPLDNDADPDGDAISLAGVPDTFTFSNGATGTITREPEGRLRIDPNGGSGVGTFEYTIVDSVGLVSAPATVTVEVNGAPTVDTPITVTATPGSTQQVPVNASDPDGDSLTLSIVGDPSPLIASVLGMTISVLVPPDMPAGTYEVRFRVTDSTGAVAEGVIVVTVVPATTTTAPPATTTTVPTTTTTLPPNGGD